MLTFGIILMITEHYTDTLLYIHILKKLLHDTVYDSKAIL